MVASGCGIDKQAGDIPPFSLPPAPLHLFDTNQDVRRVSIGRVGEVVSREFPSVEWKAADTVFERIAALEAGKRLICNLLQLHAGWVPFLKNNLLLSATLSLPNDLLLRLNTGKYLYLLQLL